MSSVFNITDSAAKRILELSENPDNGFRVSVLGGGCAGFQYEFEYDSALDESNDEIFIHSGAKVFVDKTSLTLLKDCALQYSEDLGGARFEIKNPNAATNCSCGKSFSI